MTVRIPYDEMGVDMNNLGCVMLDVEDPGFGNNIHPRLWFTPTEEERQILGDKTSKFARETQSHVTLLYGLTENANTWRKYVDIALDGWEVPSYLEIKEFGVFAPAHGIYEVLVAHILEYGALTDAHSRLRRLPHIDGFPTYKPHMTLGYMLPGIAGYIADDFNKKFKYAGVTTTGLNYGREPR